MMIDGYDILRLLIVGGYGFVVIRSMVLLRRNNYTELSRTALHIIGVIAAMWFFTYAWVTVAFWSTAEALFVSDVSRFIASLVRVLQIPAAVGLGILQQVIDLKGHVREAASPTQDELILKLTTTDTS